MNLPVYFLSKKWFCIKQFIISAWLSSFSGMEKEVLQKHCQKFLNITESSNIVLRWSIFIDSTYIVDSISLQITLFFRFHFLYLQNERNESESFKDLFPVFKLG